MPSLVQHNTPIHSELGRKSQYHAHYNPALLYPIARQLKRDEIGVSLPLPFYGMDIWNHYEVSWLNEKGKPIVAIAEIRYDCTSPNIIESKSMKLYFNSFNNTVYKNAKAVQEIATADLSQNVGAEVTVKLTPLDEFKNEEIVSGFENVICLDGLDVACSVYDIDASLLKTENEDVHESLYSNLLKSNCLVTYQPDWGSVKIDYQGQKINHASLIQYIVSFRNHNEFHEQCIERIFMDIMQQCHPVSLTVYGRYTRRGGLDINPIRSTQKLKTVRNIRLCRQ